MGNFSCSSCGGEFHIPLQSTFTCPNCHFSLPDNTAQISEQVREGVGYGSLGEPIAYSVSDVVLKSKFDSVLERASELWLARQEKYGPTNIAATGALGCFVRATDKLARLREVYINSRGSEATDETIADSWLDLLNYAAMGLMCHEKQWPGV